MPARQPTPESNAEKRLKLFATYLPYIVIIGLALEGRSKDLRMEKISQERIQERKEVDADRRELIFFWRDAFTLSQRMLENNINHDSSKNISHHSDPIHDSLVSARK